MAAAFKFSLARREMLSATGLSPSGDKIGRCRLGMQAAQQDIHVGIQRGRRVVRFRLPRAANRARGRR